MCTSRPLCPGSCRCISAQTSAASGLPSLRKEAKQDRAFFDKWQRTKKVSSPLRELSELRADAQDIQRMRTAILIRNRKECLRNAWEALKLAGLFVYFMF